MKLIRPGYFYMSAKVTELFHKQLNQNTCVHEHEEKLKDPLPGQVLSKVGFL